RSRSSSSPAPGSAYAAGSPSPSHRRCACARPADMAAAGFPLTLAGAGRPGRATAVDSAAVRLYDRMEVEDLAEAWGGLAGRAAEESPFLDPDILLPALRFLDRRGTVRIAAVRHADGRLAALAPVRRRRLGHTAPAVAVWTHPFGPLGTPLIDGIDC